MNFSNHCIGILLISLLCFTACQKDNSANRTEITSFTVSQASDNIVFNFSASGQDIQYYRIKYYSPNSGSSGSFATNEASTVTKTISELFIQPGEFYVFEIEAVLNDNSVISNADPVTLNIGDFCAAPNNLGFSVAGGFNWSSGNNTNPSYYEISYGITGIQPSAGDIITTNTTSSKEMVLEQGKIYDFYVRSFCNSTLGWSNWVGPLTEYAAQNLNVCTPPSNLAFFVVRNSLSQAVGARCTWDDNGGNTNYEVNMVGNGAPPTSGNIETASSTQITYAPMTQNTEYDFYVRTICADGTPTSWVGPLNVNIGQ